MTLDPIPVLSEQVLARGIGFTEGPLWMADGYLLVTSMSRGWLYQVDLKGRVERVAETGGGPSGLTLDSQGKVWVAQNGDLNKISTSARPTGPCLQMWDDGVHDVAIPGAHAPIDCLTTPDGAIWFSDAPGSAGSDQLENGYLRSHDPRSGESTVLAHGPWFPNGLALGRNDDVLFISDYRGSRILRFAVQDGALGQAETLATFEAGRPDGMAIAANGDIYVAMADGEYIAVVSEDGEIRGKIALTNGGFPTSACFGGPNLDLLIVTAARGGHVLALDLGISGLDPQRRR